MQKYNSLFYSLVLPYRDWGQRSRGCILCCIFRKPLARFAWNFLTSPECYIGSIWRNFFFILRPVMTSQYHSVMASFSIFRYFDFFLFDFWLRIYQRSIVESLKSNGWLQIKEFTMRGQRPPLWKLQIEW